MIDTGIAWGGQHKGRQETFLSLSLYRFCCCGNTERKRGDSLCGIAVEVLRSGGTTAAALWMLLPEKESIELD